MLEGETRAVDRDVGQSIADSLLGLEPEIAVEIVKGRQLLPQLIDLDASGGRVALTADYRPDRIRIFAADGEVVRAAHG